MLSPRVFLTAAVACCCWTISSRGVAEGLTEQAISILKNRCHSCHGVEYKYDKLNVLDHEVLVAASKDDLQDPFVTPGDPALSKLWHVIKDGRMPPRNELPEEEQAVLKQWIEAGAGWVVNDSREFVTNEQVLERIESHLFRVNKEDRQFQRYFSLVHLYNNPKISSRDLRVYRAAFSKAVNSMSDQSSIVLPSAIDEEEAIYNIDLRHYGWEDLSKWEQVLEFYPYGLKPTQPDKAVRSFNQIEELYGISFDGVAYLRADWFVATATRPPLYHVLTSTPDTIDVLLEDAGVSVRKGLELGTLKRAGLFESGVSGQNRMIEYHSSRTGLFWISYDFELKAGRSNLARFPLGPKFEGNKFDAFAFEHAGGEIIYTLPNGLQGYMLVDGDGDRIDAGPVDIVWDAGNVSGSPLIVNGLSCMSCHKHGILPITDYVREGHAVGGQEARRKIAEIYVPQAELDQDVKDARQLYLNKLMITIGSYFDLDRGDLKSLLEIEEPVSRVSMLYNKSLDLVTASTELGLQDTNVLRGSVNNNRDVQRLGLGPLAIDGGTIKRSFWDSQESTSSVFQEAAAQLNAGRPVSQIGN